MNFANTTKILRKSGVFALKRPGVLAIQTSCLAALVLGVVWNVRFAVADLAARQQLLAEQALHRRLDGVAGYAPLDADFGMDALHVGLTLGPDAFHDGEFEIAEIEDR